MDMAHLRYLGPLARALDVILGSTEKYKQVKHEPGISYLDMDLEDYQHQFMGCFFLYKGVLMKDKWIDDWRQYIGKKITKELKFQEKTNEEKAKRGKLQNNFKKIVGEKKVKKGETWVETNQLQYVRIDQYMSTSESLPVALNFAKRGGSQMKPVLFVMLMQNFKLANAHIGFRMNEISYSRHHQEQEYLLQDGTPFVVLQVEELTIDNSLKTIENDDLSFLDDFNGE